MNSGHSSRFATHDDDATGSTRKPQDTYTARALLNPSSLPPHLDSTLALSRVTPTVCYHCSNPSYSWGKRDKIREKFLVQSLICYPLPKPRYTSMPLQVTKYFQVSGEKIVNIKGDGYFSRQYDVNFMNKNHCATRSLLKQMNVILTISLLMDERT